MSNPKRRLEALFQPPEIDHRKVAVEVSQEARWCFRDVARSMVLQGSYRNGTDIDIVSDVDLLLFGSWSPLIIYGYRTVDELDEDGLAIPLPYEKLHGGGMIYYRRDNTKKLTIPNSHLFEGFDNTSYKSRKNGYSSTQFDIIFNSSLSKHYSEFRKEVFDHCNTSSNPTDGGVSIKVPANMFSYDASGNVDIVPCIEGKFFERPPVGVPIRAGGFRRCILVWPTDGRPPLLSFPLEHTSRLFSKNSRAVTGGRFKATIRAFKRLQYLGVSEGYISTPIKSYWIENLLFHVPNRYYTVDMRDTLIMCMKVVSDMTISSSGFLLQTHGLLPLFGTQFADKGKISATWEELMTFSKNYLQV
jgi:hypothetical protein